MIKDNIIYGPPLPIPTPNESSGIVLYKKLMQHVYSNIKVFVDEVTGEYLTYAQFLQLSCSLAESLRKDGINSNDVIALSSENSIYFSIVVVAALFIGVPLTTINPAYTETESTHALNLVSSSIIFCSNAHYDKFLKLKSKHRHIRKIIVIDCENLPGAVSLMDFIKAHRALYTDINNFTPTSLDSSYNTALIMFSSGTTGLPKGVMITHKNINARLMSVNNPQIWVHSANPHVLGLLPFFHSLGLQLILGYIYDGKTIHVLEKFEPMIYLKCIEKCRVENIIVVPTLLAFLATHPIVDKFDLSCLKDISYGSSPSAPEIVKAFTRRFNVVPREGYGLTEATLAVTFNPIVVVKSGTVGHLYPGMSACIRDPDTGAKLGPNQNGELCLKGDLVMKGYYKNEVATNETFTEDGYLRTGDVGYYDNEEYLYIVDRMKELIKYKSFQVAPVELESILITHPKIKQVAVVGLPDKKAGELPMAFVVKEPDTYLNEAEVKSYLAKFLSKNKHLHGGVVFVNEIPLNALGKISRKDVRQLLPKLKSKL